MTGIGHIVEIGPIVGIYCLSITKMVIKRRTITISRTREIGENIKITIKTNIGVKISMIVIDPVIQMIHIVEIGH